MPNSVVVHAQQALTTMETEAYTGPEMKRMRRQRMEPARAVCQVKYLKRGRKLGAPEGRASGSSGSEQASKAQPQLCTRGGEHTRDAQHKAGGVGEAVDEEEEARDEGGDHVEVAHKEAGLGNEPGQQDRNAGLVTLLAAPGKDPEEGEQVVASQGLQHTRTANEARQRRGDGGGKQANDDKDLAEAHVLHDVQVGAQLLALHTGTNDQHKEGVAARQRWGEVR